MTLTSSTLFISSLSPLIILFPSWLLWGCLINHHKSSTWALFSLPLRFIPLVKFCCPPNDIKIFCVILFFLPLFSTEGFKQGCSAYKHAPKIQRCRSGFWYPLSMFHLEAFLFASLLPLLPNFWNQLVIFYSTLMTFFKGFWVQAHWNALRPSCLLAGGSFHF